jgi:predicted dehydrogenase
MDRRTFTLSSLAAAGALTTSHKVLGAADRTPKVGLVGCGWFGRLVLESMAEHSEMDCISLCDPNADALKLARDSISKHQASAPRAFSDYREVLDSAKHDIVIVSTPDHWHALPAIAAMQAGADVFLEKPITVDVMEGEALVAAARKYDRVVQVNTQRRSSALLAQARNRYLRSGRSRAILTCHPGPRSRCRSGRRPPI